MKRLAPIILAAALVGCAPAAVDMDFDDDQDGLLNEDAAGTDPTNPDSDGDGHLDGEEVEKGTDALNGDDYPYFGGWPIDTECREGISATGNSVGDITDTFKAMSQHGDEVKLYDFCARTIVIVSGAFW